MFDASTQKALQEVFILATGRGANSNEMEMLEGWSGENGDWGPLIAVVNAYMADQAAAHGTRRHLPDAGPERPRHELEQRRGRCARAAD